MMRGGRPRRWPGWVVLTIVLLVCCAPGAWAASDDQIDTFDVTITVNADGSLLVRERLVWRFGVNSTRHGIERWLVTRLPFDDQRDEVYDISNPTVTSSSQPSPVVSVQRDLGSGRTRLMRIRVGDSDRTLPGPTAGYELSYTVRGAVRDFADFDEVGWNVTGPRLPKVISASGTLRAPGGVRKVSCSTGSAGTGGRCTSGPVDGGVGSFAATSLAAGSPMTVVATIGDGLVQGAGPTLVESSDLVDQRTNRFALVAGLVGALLVPLLGWWYYRRHGHDLRFDEVPAGELPEPGASVTQVRDHRVEPPVRKSPPPLALAEAGLLLAGRSSTRQTTATLVGLAVDGAIRLRVGADPEARLLESRRARDRSSAVLLEELFDGGGTVADLRAPGVLAEAHERILADARSRAEHEQWFVRPPRTRSVGVLVIAALALGYIAYLVIGVAVLYLTPLWASTVITLVVLNRGLQRGQRTALGRALTDQVQGFRTHLATVTAEQLSDEADDDLYSRYLPWAIMFDLSHRWTRVCAQLVAQGRITGAAPTWYVGSQWSLRGFAGQVDSLSAQVRAATTATDLAGSA